jgi:glutamate-1-semialdehyde aminotransferase
LQELRKITAQSDTAFICDEIVTGFRVHPGGAQALFGFQADIATYGKVIGGGVPIGVVAGKAKYMNALDGGTWQYGDDSGPEVGVTFFAGTFVRHPLALAATWACLKHLQEHSPELQRRLNQRTSQLVETLSAYAVQVGAPLRLTHFSSLFWINFPADFQYAHLFFAHMREKGVHMWDGRAGVLTTVHTDEDLERMVNAYKMTIKEMQAGGFLACSASDQPPVPGARLGKDSKGNSAWFIPDPERPGKYLQVGV